MALLRGIIDNAVTVQPQGTKTQKTNMDDAIINPAKGVNSPDPGTLSVLVGTIGDTDRLCRLMKIDRNAYQRIFISKLYSPENHKSDVSIVGPIIGAPYAVMLLETLIAWGARSFIFFGWCGAISPEVKIGDILIPTSAVVDEGTSIHYGQSKDSVVRPSSATIDSIKTILNDRNIAFQQGQIWSTDAIFRETPDKVSHYQSTGVVAVEMELSALFSVGRFRNIDVGGILVVSDELSTLKWHPGFKDERFKLGRKGACEVISQVCHQI